MTIAMSRNAMRMAVFMGAILRKSLRQEAESKNLKGRRRSQAAATEEVFGEGGETGSM
jgi:hypothetical protein